MIFTPVELIYETGRGLGNYFRLLAVQEALYELEVPSWLTTVPSFPGARGYDVYDRRKVPEDALLVMDNWGYGHYEGKVVVSCDPTCKFTGSSCFLLGPRYASLSSPFWGVDDPPEIRERCENIFYYQSSEFLPGPGITKYTPESLRKYDLAVVHGGLIVYECLRAGVPVISHPQNKEQLLNINHLYRMNAVKMVRSKTELKRAISEITMASRAQMQAEGRKLVDGQGARRIAQAVKDYL